MDELDEGTKTEKLLEEAFDLYVCGIDPSLIYNILMEHKISSTKAQSIMRWAKAKAANLGWL